MVTCAIIIFVIFVPLQNAKAIQLYVGKFPPTINSPSQPTPFYLQLILQPFEHVPISKISFFLDGKDVGDFDNQCKALSGSTIIQITNSACPFPLAGTPVNQTGQLYGFGVIYGYGPSLLGSYGFGAGPVVPGLGSYAIGAGPQSWVFPLTINTQGLTLGTHTIEVRLDTGIGGSLSVVTSGQTTFTIVLAPGYLSVNAVDMNGNPIPGTASGVSAQMQEYVMNGTNYIATGSAPITFNSLQPGVTYTALASDFCSTTQCVLFDHYTDGTTTRSHNFSVTANATIQLTPVYRVVSLAGNGGFSTTIPVGTSPQAIAVNPVTNMTYVANYQDNTVSVINDANN
jgi:hypothetical protein